jgi:hypothetical protein
MPPVPNRGIGGGERVRLQLREVAGIARFLGRLLPWTCHSRDALSVRLQLFYAYDLYSEIAQPVEDAVKLRRVNDVGREYGGAAVRPRRNPCECARQQLTELASHHDPVPPSSSDALLIGHRSVLPRTYVFGHLEASSSGG